MVLHSVGNDGECGFKRISRSVLRGLVLRFRSLCLTFVAFDYVVGEFRARRVRTLLISLSCVRPFVCLRPIAGFLHVLSPRLSKLPGGAASFSLPTVLIWLSRRNRRFSASNPRCPSMQGQKQTFVPTPAKLENAVWSEKLCDCVYVEKFVTAITSER